MNLHTPTPFTQANPPASAPTVALILDPRDRVLSVWSSRGIAEAFLATNPYEDYPPGRCKVVDHLVSSGFMS